MANKRLLTTGKHIDHFIYLSKKYVSTYIGIAISVVLFIQFFQPFSIDKFDFENKLLFIAGFGLIILICLQVSQVIFQSRLIKSEDEIATDTIYLPIFFFSQVVSTSVAFTFYIRYVGQVPITFNTVVKVVIICLSLPVTIYLKDKNASYQIRIKKLIQESRILQEKMKKFSENYANKYIEITSENESDNFRIQVSEIVYAKSADNYVEIGYLDEGTVKKKMVRNTLRNIEQQLSEFNNYIRTHRTSLVNIQYIDKLNKNFNTYWLSLDKTKETIPVSRQYLMAVKDLL